MHLSQLKGGFISNGFNVAGQTNGRKCKMILYTESTNEPHKSLFPIFVQHLSLVGQS